MAKIDIKFVFSIAAVLVGIFGAFIPYLRDMFRGKTKPHAYTWLIWSITQGTAVAGLWYGNGGWGTLALFIGASFVFLVFLFSLKYGTRNITKGDTIVLVAALLAIVVWWQLHNPLLAIIMVSAIDVSGYWPSIRKTFEEPWTETPASWAVFCVANVLTMVSLSEYNFLTLTYLIAITAANVVLLVICLTRRKTVPRPETKTMPIT